MTHRDDHELRRLRELTIDNLSFSYIDRSQIHGFGLFAGANIRNGTMLGILDGQVMAWDLYDRIVDHFQREITGFASELFMEWNALSETVLLVRPFRTKYSLINHCRKPNLKLHRDPLRVMTARDISRNEELLLDYRDEPLRESYLDGHGKAFL